MSFDTIALWVGRFFILSLMMLVIVLCWIWVTEKIWVAHSNLMLAGHYCLKINPKGFLDYVHGKVRR